MDNPFDVPSFSIQDGVSVETFINQAQQARGGNIVVFTFHGVPDREHPGISLEPATFKVMMQYLREENYQCIAMRDLAKYIDPVMAAKLPRTLPTYKWPLSTATTQDAKTRVGVIAKDIQNFEFPGLPHVRRRQTNFSVTVPYATDVTAQDGSKQVFTVRVVKSDKSNNFNRTDAESGNWSDSSKWITHFGKAAAPTVNG
ncbi:MAG: hypothetical protein O2856_16670, partial [Planctomycetota bacterium]|nr:hypothetical protein [Planctomycetota bacterium]